MALAAVQCPKCKTVHHCWSTAEAFTRHIACTECGHRFIAVWIYHDGGYEVHMTARQVHRFAPAFG